MEVTYTGSTFVHFNVIAVGFGLSVTCEALADILSGGVTEVAKVLNCTTSFKSENWNVQVRDDCVHRILHKVQRWESLKNVIR